MEEKSAISVVADSAYKAGKAEGFRMAMQIVANMAVKIDQKTSAMMALSLAVNDLSDAHAVARKEAGI